MMYTYNLITIYKIIYYNFIVISYILYLHIIHKKFLYMSPRKLTWISKMTPYLLPEIHFFQNRTCLFVFFKIFRGLIYIMYIYTCTFQLLLPDLYPFNCLLLNFNPQPPRTRTFVFPPPRDGHPAPSVLPWRLLPWEPSNGGSLQMGGVFSPPTQIKKKMLFKLKHMSSCLFPFLKVRVFCGFFLCFEEFL